MVQQGRASFDRSLCPVEDAAEDNEDAVADHRKSEGMHARGMMRLRQRMYGADDRGEHHRLTDQPQIANIVSAKPGVKFAQN